MGNLLSAGICDDTMRLMIHYPLNIEDGRECRVFGLNPDFLLDLPLPTATCWIEPLPPSPRSSSGRMRAIFSRGMAVPVAYEIPREVVAEAIVNAVAHRNYTSNGSVQVMLFADRLEVWNPGGLPPPLTLEKLRHPHGSVPFNPQLAEPLYLTKYIERMGTGTGDMIRRCREVGLPDYAFL